MLSTQKSQAAARPRGARITASMGLRSPPARDPHGCGCFFIFQIRLDITLPTIGGRGRGLPGSDPHDAGPAGDVRL